jgi:hypothetical protein
MQRSWSCWFLVFWVAGCSEAIESNSPSGATGGVSSGGDGGTHSAGTAGSANTGGTGATDTASGGSESTSGGSANAGSSSGGTPNTLEPPPPNVCVLSDCEPGHWVPVTPDGVSLTEGACGNYGTKSVQVDPVHPERLYTMFHCQGVFQSDDYGQTWNGPINTGENAAPVTDCAGLVALPPAKISEASMLYVACIRGSGTGFWRSTNAGVDFTNSVVAPGSERSGQQFYPPVIDPYDDLHLLMAGHGVSLLVESTDGGETWSENVLPETMSESPGTIGINFVDAGSAAATHGNWLWMGDQVGGTTGTWRTTDAGENWHNVESNRHTSGATQIYQPDTSGLLFMAGVYSDLGWGAFRSTDFGETWAHVGTGKQQAIVFGTPNSVYAMFGWGIGEAGIVDPALERSAHPGAGDWTEPGTPESMTQGPAQAAVTSDGVNHIVLTANYNAGLWRYVEPAE